MGSQPVGTGMWAEPVRGTEPEPVPQAGVPLGSLSDSRATTGMNELLHRGDRSYGDIQGPGRARYGPAGAIVMCIMEQAGENQERKNTHRRAGGRAHASVLLHG